MFNVDFYQLIYTQLPPQWWKPLRLVWLRFLLADLKGRYKDFRQYRQAQIQLAQYSGQMMYLELFMNDTYDAEDRRITLTDQNDADVVYFYNFNEADGDEYFYEQWEVSATYALDAHVVWDEGSDQHAIYKAIQAVPANTSLLDSSYWVAVGENVAFYNFGEQNVLAGAGAVINIPSSITLDESEVLARLDRWRIAGKTFIINRV